MTAEQFVFWLRGFTARAPTTGFTSSEWKAVTETLKLVASPQADADARLVAQKRLYAERDAFLKELDAREQGQVLAPTSCTGGPIL